MEQYSGPLKVGSWETPMERYSELPLLQLASHWVCAKVTHSEPSMVASSELLREESWGTQKERHLEGS